jgi:hypothetical protein
MGKRHRKKPENETQLYSVHALTIRGFLAIAAAHNQNADGGSIGKRHGRRRAFSARCGLKRFVGNLVLKSSITVVERSVVVIHAHAPDLVIASYKQRSA